MNTVKQDLLYYTNPEQRSGTLQEAIVDANVFIDVRSGNLLKAEDIRTMGKDAIIFALANLKLEIIPEEALFKLNQK